MPRNNIKFMDKDLQNQFLEIYDFDYDKKTDEVIVKIKSTVRQTRHNASRPFSINSRVRKVNFTVEALSLWKNSLKDQGYNLLEVQQSINLLTIMYQAITEKNVIAKIKNPEVKLERL